MAASRTQLPTYDLIAGTDGTATALPSATSRLPLASSTTRRTSFSAQHGAGGRRASLIGGPSAVPVRSTIDNEALRAQIKTLSYELEIAKQERAMEVETLRGHVREVERKLGTEALRAGEAEQARQAAERRLEEGRREMSDVHSRGAEDRESLERRLRDKVEEVRGLREEVEEGREEVERFKRDGARGEREMQGRCEALEKRAIRAEGERDSNLETIKALKEESQDWQIKAGGLEQEILKLRALTGDQGTLGVVKRELGEQVAHIKRLEKGNADLNAEVKRLRRERKAVEVVEEEKRVIEVKLGLLDDVRRELGESEIKRRMLEDERRAWSAYLEDQQGEASFDSPEDMARAFVQERIERLQLVERLGKIQPELAIRDDAVNTLERENAALQAEVKKLKTTVAPAGSSGDSKATSRLDRQRMLAVKEVEYLRAQLRSLEDETTEFDPEKADEGTTSKTADLERLVDEYKKELSDMHQQMSKLEAQPAQPVVTSLKRSAPETEDNEAMGTLQRKLRKLQSVVVSLDSKNATLSSDLKATKTQLSALQESSRTRVLELSKNPTAQHEAVKMTALKALRAENESLLAQIQGGSPPPASLPAAVVESLQLQLKERDAELAQRDKKTLRLRQIWSGKVLEYQEAVASTLGWNVKFLPHGNLQLSPVYYPTGINPENGEEEENYILFDVEKGTMKVSGGERSRFAQEIRDMVEFWIEGRKEVPCFLAATALEFWDRSQSAKDMERNEVSY